MKRRLGVLFLVLLLATLPGAATAQVVSGCPGTTRLVAYAHEAITVSSTALTFTTATMLPTGVNPVAIKITVETDAIRYLDTGTAPTDSTGHQSDPGEVLWVCGSSIGRFQMIRKTNNATARVTFYRGS